MVGDVIWVVGDDCRFTLGGWGGWKCNLGGLGCNLGGWGWSGMVEDGWGWLRGLLHKV